MPTFDSTFPEPSVTWTVVVKLPPLPTTTEQLFAFAHAPPDGPVQRSCCTQVPALAVAAPGPVETQLARAGAPATRTDPAAATASTPGSRHPMLRTAISSKSSR